MEKFIINGGKSLNGAVSISGMKNSALPVLFGTILTNDICIIENLPNTIITNVTQMLRTSCNKWHINTNFLVCQPFFEIFLFLFFSHFRFAHKNGHKKRGLSPLATNLKHQYGGSYCGIE